MFSKKCIKDSKTKKIKKLIIWLLIIAVIFIAVLCYFNNYVNPTIIATNNAVIKQKTISIINDSVDEVYLNNSYDDLITIKYDSDNKITAINANTTKVNELKTALVKVCQEKLSNITNLTFSVPLGTFTGIPILNGIGPNIEIRMVR